LSERGRKAARRWFTASRAQTDARRDEALRRVDPDILDEPIPEKPREVLPSERGEAEVKPKRSK
jgi:hypothetical protein